jgi:hypothetical protein
MFTPSISLSSDNHTPCSTSCVSALVIGNWGNIIIGGLIINRSSHRRLLKESNNHKTNSVEWIMEVWLPHNQLIWKSPVQQIPMSFVQVRCWLGDPELKPKSLKPLLQPLLLYCCLDQALHHMHGCCFPHIKIHEVDPAQTKQNSLTPYLSGRTL